MTNLEKMEELVSISKTYGVPLEILKCASESFANLTVEEVEEFEQRETAKHSVRHLGC